MHYGNNFVGNVVNACEKGNRDFTPSGHLSKTFSSTPRLPLPLDILVVVVACVEELTNAGIYQSCLFRALAGGDRHLQLIDVFDKGAYVCAQFIMGGHDNG
ncbi:hypothetical protein PAXINDRAFT_101354 [Paxillus involutus ATCC 200175]|uniref:Uncharacterized protein n=1 Tax=Paxillus involutus ATCC 200175 TaxID=664439 RepID=A0A0C9STJ8_PAXIN|nr:hypothetical protein PAXINDRAFT_101354 [Paxillus involutus ATCC 200175]